MDNYCSPQCVDFTSTPDVPSDDYFEKNHEIYEYKPCAQIPQVKTTLEDKENIENTNTNTNIGDTNINDEKLETELNIIKNTPIKVIYSPTSLRKSIKCKHTKKMTYHDILNEAIKTFEHCVPTKLDIFKKPVPIKNDLTKYLQFHVADNDQVNVLPSITVEQVTDGKHNQEIKALSSTNSCNFDTSSNDSLKNNEPNCEPSINSSTFCTPVNCMKSLKVSIPNKQEQCLSIGKDSNSKRLKTATYQCRRRSLVVHRRSNQFVSLAAAVHKFQNETPERFHTKSSKDLKIKTASAKCHSFVTRKTMFTKPSIKRRSVPALSQKEEKDSKSHEMKEITYGKASPKNLTKTPNATKSRRSYLNVSTKNTARNKHVVSTIVDNNGSEIILKKEKILFFDIPIHTKQKATTRPVPFSFEYRDKAKKQATSKQLELKDNKSVNNAKSQNIETKISEKKIKTSSAGTQNKARSSIIEKNRRSNYAETNGETSKVSRTTNTLKNNSHNKSKNDEKNLASTSKNLKETMKVNKSRSMSSLKPYEKTEDKNKKNEHSHGKDTEQVKEQSTSMFSKNSFDKRKDISEDKITEHSAQTKHINQVKKQSSFVLCKEKIKSRNEKIETKEDLNKMKRKSATSNININSASQENKCSNINASMTDKDLSQTKNIKHKSIIRGMNSYERGKQRHEFDKRINEKIKMQEEMRKKMEADKLAREKLEIAQLRKQLEVKARPLPIYKPFIPIKSTKPLTEPQSPAWAYKNKIKKAT